MPAIVTIPCRTYTAKKFLEGLETTHPRSDNSVFLFIGKTLPWSSVDAVGANDNSPPLPIDTVLNHNKVWDNLYHLKRINATDTSLVIRRFDWTKDTVYQQYEPDIEFFDPLLGLQPFYIITDDLNVYKCLFNFNGGNSYVKPSGTSTNIITTGDGYHWKYMYTVNPADREKFLTNEWIPVKTLLVSDNTKQWDVQQNAVNGGIPVIQVINQGSGYTIAPAVAITGDGTSATAEATIKNGKVTSVTVTNPGVNYTNATAIVESGQVTALTITVPGSGYISTPGVLITGTGSGATAHAVITAGVVTSLVIDTAGSGYTVPPSVTIAPGTGIQAEAAASISTGVELKVLISPPGGHGADPVAELGGFFAMLNVKLQFEENGKFTIANNFRQLGLLVNPIQDSTQLVATGTTYSQAWSFLLQNVVGNFVADAVVIGSESGATGVVLDFIDDVLRIVNVVGTFVPGDNVATEDTLNSGDVQYVSGTAQGAGTLQITISNADASATGFYEGFTINITGNTGEGQQRIITAYDGTTKEAIISEDWTIEPDNTSTYSIAKISYPDLKKFSGNIMYIENRRPITRASLQIESFSPVIEF